MKASSRHVLLPSDMAVEYSLEQLSTVPPATWARFITAVMHIYYSLPFCCRPVNPRVNNERTDIYRLFNPWDTPHNVDRLVFGNLPENELSRCIVTITREVSQEVPALEVVTTEHRLSVDIFTRMVLLALHNVCGGHFQVHSTAGARSWAMPLALLTSLSLTTCFAGWVAPDDARYAAAFGSRDARLTEQLIIHCLTQNPGINLTGELWETIVSLEFSLYEPVPAMADPEVNGAC